MRRCAPSDPGALAPAPALRYYAVLDFAALTHHGLTGEERRQLQRLVDDPATDPAIRPVIAGLLHRSTLAALRRRSQ